MTSVHRKGVNIMRKRIIRYSVVILLILLYIGAFDNQKADAKENKVSKITLKIGGDYVSVKRPSVVTC